MQNIFSSSERVVLNLRESQYQGLSEFEALVQNTDVPLPFGVEVLELEPKIIPIRLDREIRKEVEVRAQLSGDLAAKLRLVEQDVSPTPVMIRGPVEVMRRIGVLRTEPINRATLEGRGTIPIGINDLDSRVTIEGLEADGFQFSYSVKAETANLTIKNVKIRFLATRQNFSSEIKEAALDVLAPEGRKLRASEVQVIADIPEKTSDAKVRVKLRAVLPEGVHLLQIHPEEINVKLQ
jgi:YbbR domain-containing protein